MPTGAMKWVNAQKGYGFIQQAAGSKGVFVHISAVERSGLGGLRVRPESSYWIAKLSQHQAD